MSDGLDWLRGLTVLASLGLWVSGIIFVLVGEPERAIAFGVLAFAGTSFTRD